MPEVGVKELQTRTSQILRDVREKRISYIITHRGRPTGMLVPISEEQADEERPRANEDQVWEEFLRLCRELQKKCQPDLSTEQILRE